MNKATCILPLFLLASALRAQDSVQTHIRSQTVLNRLSGQNGVGRADMISELPFPEKKVLGSTYLAEEWNVATLRLYKDSSVLKGLPVKYDLKQNELDIRTPRGIKALPASRVNCFVWVDEATGNVSYFDNVRNYQQDLVPEGMFQLLADGKLVLLKKTDIVVRKADYNVALNVGSRDDVILKESKYYFLSATKSFALLPKNKKKFLDIFGTSRESIAKFIDEKSLRTNDEGDLQQIFIYYNAN